METLKYFSGKEREGAGWGLGGGSAFNPSGLETSRTERSACRILTVAEKAKSKSPGSLQGRWEEKEQKGAILPRSARKELALERVLAASGSCLPLQVSGWTDGRFQPRRFLPVGGHSYASATRHPAF